MDLSWQKNASKVKLTIGKFLGEVKVGDRKFTFKKHLRSYTMLIFMILYSEKGWKGSKLCLDLMWGDFIKPFKKEQFTTHEMIKGGKEEETWKNHDLFKFWTALAPTLILDILKAGSPTFHGKQKAI